MTPEELTTQRMIDRLVDGELSERDRRAVLSALEDRAEAWRDCALAFVENQEFMRTIPTLSPALPGAHAVSPAPGSSRFVWTGLLALAATAFFAFVLGIRSDAWLRRHEAAPLVVETTGNSPSARLVNDKTGQGSAFSLEDFLTRDSVIPSQLLQDLEQSGNVVQKHRGLVPMVRSDGSQVLVPYEELQITPVNHMTH